MWIVNNIFVIINRFRNLKFKTKLIISYIILITLPLGILWYKFYDTSMEVIYELARKNVYEIVKQNNQIIDAQLDKVYENSQNMITDQVLYNEFSKVKPDDKYSLIEMDKKLVSVISKYLPEGRDVYSAQIVTSYYSFGNSTSYIPYKEFNKTDIYKKAVESNGGLQWIPTYNYLKMFNMEYLYSANLDYKYLFSAVRLLNCSYVDNGVVTSLNKYTERPVLVVSFKESLFRKVFEDSIPVKGSYYFIADRNGNIISHSNKDKIAAHEKTDWLDELVYRGSGTSFINIDGKKVIACYDTSKVTGWISVVVLSQDALMGYIIDEMKAYTMMLALILLAISIFFAYLISNSITKPLNKLLKAIKKTGEGDFDSKIDEHDKGEIGYIIKKFNNMNDKIKLLIEENYKSKIREKETEIMALNIQLNPHFLYNTLNIINWIAIEKGQKEVSKLLISLSSMLHYTSRNHTEMTKFKDDFEWLKNYILIMSYRYENKFSVNYNIDFELLEYEVPKLFLQPFIENSIIHGFENIESGGIINISGWIEDDKRYFTIEDNGKGMEENKINTSLKQESDGVGIKNVDRRIKLIYGDDYGVNIESKIGAGTKIKIILPLC